MRALGLIGRRRLDMGTRLVPLMMAVMSEREKDATLEVLERAVELGSATRRSPRGPAGDILP
jgi:hypothetical protein